jgi:uncharacterized membrane protein YbhN (UPF0104 family)
MPPGTARWLARAAITAAIVGFVAAEVDLGDLGRTLTTIRPAPFAAAALLYLAGQVLSAWRWAVVARGLGLKMPGAAYVRFYFIGMFFNIFGPSTVGGDVARALYLGEGRRRALAAGSVVFDRGSGLALLIAIAALALLAFPRWDLPAPLVGGVVTAAVVLVLACAIYPRVVRRLPAHNRLRRLLERELAPLWRDPGLLVRVAAMSATFHLSQVGVQWVLARAVGVALPLSYCLVFHPLMSVMMALPVSLGGFGVREAGYLYFLGRIGVGDAVAVTMGLLWFAITLVGGMVGGAVFLAGGARLPRLRAEPASVLDLS